MIDCFCWFSYAVDRYIDGVQKEMISIVEVRLRSFSYDAEKIFTESSQWWISVNGSLGNMDSYSNRLE